MSSPEVILEWAPDDLPSSETPTWVDITSYLREWEWSYGRNDENGEFEPGQGYVLLDNRDRSFDPAFPTGPWYGKIKPRRKFRMRCVWDSVTYPLFHAHARGFPQQYPSETDKVVRVELADALAILRAVDLDALGFNRPEEMTGDRLDAILDAALIPAAERNFDQGTVTVAATGSIYKVGVVDLPQPLGSALNQATMVVDAENGGIYVRRSGHMGYFG